MAHVMLGSLLLAAVFATAAVAKLRDPTGSREAMQAFGVPARLAGWLGLAVPVSELAVALALVVGSTRTWGALGGLILLTGFSLAIGWNLAHGRTPDCHCFGQLHSSPAGPRTLARNAGLIALAGLVASQADPLWSAIAGSAGLTGAVAGWALARRAEQAASDPSIEGLAIGSPAPSFELPRLDGQIIGLRSLLGAGKPTLLVFSDAGCGPCQALAPDVADWQRRYPGDLTIAVIESRPQDRSERPESDPHERRNVLLQRDSEVSDSYRAQGTPTAVLIAADGAIASEIAAGGVAIEALVAASVDRFEPRTESPRPERWALPRLIGGPQVRRDFLVRGATAGAAISMVMAWPRQALGMAPAGAARCGRYSQRCGNRCCPRGTICNRSGKGRPCKNNGCGGGFPDRCDDGCTNLDTFPGTCGGCGRSCKKGEICSGGKCVPRNDDGCPQRCLAANAICCGGVCIYPNEDEDNCGGCGVQCTGPRPKCCDGHCVPDLDSDPFNCGGCLKRCGSKQVCYRGECRDECPKGLRQCGRTCGQPSTQACCKGKLIDRDDLQFDEDNCGECGNECGGIFGPGTCCGGKCVELGLDPCNCGECGKVCAPGEYCRGDDGCICPLGQTCPGDHPPHDCGSASRSSPRFFGRRRPR